MLDTRSARQSKSSSGFVPARHADDGTLGLYVLGDLSLASTLATEEHLSSCQRCKIQLQQVEAVVAALRA